MNQNKTTIKGRIIEVCEVGYPKSIIHRENDPITEMINTDDLVEELLEEIDNAIEKKLNDWETLGDGTGDNLNGLL